VLLSAIAARTSRIRLGCSVSVLPIHCQPLHIAEDYAMVDAVSDGRLEFGVGVGNNPSEYRRLGISMDEGRARYQEALDIILKVWSQENVSHKGEFWQFEDVTTYPRPVQQPHPPLWVAGTSEASLGAAGRQGYNIMTVAHPRPPEEIRPGVAAWRAGLVDGGYDPAQRHCLIHLRGYVDPDHGRACEVGPVAIARYNQISREGLGRAARPDETNWDKMLAEGRNIYGDPSQCVELMNHTRSHFDFDVFGMQFNFGGLPHEEVVTSMRLFAREVMPAFA
jgi:alkanesulfonate monooxygenase SsuD/methylene tetrahydromethanopterin reductase-like flavin-dependent oxidoreductase (luciferase family)